VSLLWTEAWPLLLLAPAVALLAWARDITRARRRSQVLGPRARFLANFSDRRRLVRRSFFLLALLLATVAALQPAWGAGARDVERRGVDMVVCLDVSRSMLARDIDPSRLQRAKREIRALARHARGDRIGLVLFAGDARLAVPITHDLASWSEIAALATPLSVQRGGTDLGAALKAALNALGGRTGEHEVIVLLTDGDDLAERGLAVARTCRQRNITVHCVGFGTALGAKIPLEEGGFVLDRAGREVVAKLDPTRLKKIAETTGGDYLDVAQNTLIDLHERRIRTMARRSFELDVRRARANRFQWPLLVAFILWIAFLCVGDRRS